MFWRQINIISFFPSILPELDRADARLSPMEAGIKSLVRSVLAFVGFWLVFLSGTIINAVIPLKQLQRLAVLNFLITDGMVEFQTQLVRSLTHTSSRGSFVGAIWTLFGSATFSFLRYFKEIFVLVTLFHFTPLLEGMCG